MASILCSKCANGIHYHSEPQGIQYIYFSNKAWDIICNSEFNKNANHVKYPALFRTDTIEEDFPDKFTKLWECPNCNSMTVFDKHGNKDKTLVVSDPVDLGTLIDDGIIFNDYLWDNITEAAFPNSELKNKIPSYYVKIYEEGILLSADNLFLNPQYYIEL